MLRKCDKGKVTSCSEQLKQLRLLSNLQASRRLSEAKKWHRTHMGRIWLRAASLSLTCWRARGGKAWTEKPAASERSVGRGSLELECCHTIRVLDSFAAAMEAKRDDESGDANLMEPTSPTTKSRRAEAPAVGNGMYGGDPSAGAETLAIPKRGA